MDITPYLKLMVEKNASDLFITVDSPVKIKLEGLATPVGKTILTGDICKAAAYNIMNDIQIKHFEETFECDFAIALEDGSARFRVNVFRQRGEVAMVLRLIPSKIPTVEELGLPEILNEMVMNKRGLILMVGATGSGKSTTLAAMINHRNQNSAGHILTIEDPVEFSHPNLKSILNQREVGVDTLSYRNALRASLREAPDVILIGEIRDRETMEAAMELSNTGHLALSTLHANNSNQAMERVINMFPQAAHQQLFMDLSLNIRAVISQRLVTGIDGKRCAAIEILVNTPHIADLIL
ncbi:MAG: PilT/PilU family type 4a pilus ATPase, partial [Gammaproteobacteria bacterium]|nr:PilT/PilU family type 4a pilus ATPase [Gammaproteobacteria bacterium]